MNVSPFSAWSFQSQGVLSIVRPSCVEQASTSMLVTSKLAAADRCVQCRSEETRYISGVRILPVFSPALSSTQLRPRPPLPLQLGRAHAQRGSRE